MGRRIIFALLSLWIGGLAHAESRTYVIAIGNNAPPPMGSDELHSLRYADDDAAAFFAFTRDLSRRATLLTVLDVDSQRRFPELAPVSRPPTLTELRRVVAEYRDILEQDRRAGHESTVLIFFSGHGDRSAGREPSLTLLDGPLTQAVLYDEVLSQLPARYIHLMVDACYAEAVVRPRDAQAEVVDVSDSDLKSYAARSTLARFPNVGALIATSSAAQAHEWDVYERGVFSHELLSGLRGGADVNGDGRIEYSEIYAFLSAANHSVADPRAHLAVVAHPPPLNRRAAIVDLGALRGAARLTGEASALGAFHVEDEHGNRLMDVFAEAGYRLWLALPATNVFISNRNGEAQVRLSAGKRTDLARVTLQRASMEKRGSMELALQRGLFTAPFGPTYYRAFVDRNEELVPVAFRSDDRENADVPSEPRRPNLRPAWISFGAAAGLGVATAVFSGLGYRAHEDWANTDLQRPAADARTRFYAYQGLAIGSVVGGGLATAVGIGLLLHARRSSRVMPQGTIGVGVAGLGITAPF